MSYTQNLTLFHIKDSHTTLLQYNYMYLTFYKNGHNLFLNLNFQNYSVKILHATIKACN
mgnify:CR=1 FL=1